MKTEQRHRHVDAPATDQIDVFVASVEACWEEAGAQGYPMLLEPAEISRAAQFVFERDRRRFIVTRALARTVLAEATGLAPAELRFTQNAWGRPEIANAQARSLDIRFNLSHTADLIVLAVTSTRDVGVDVERVGARDVPLDLADRFFAPSESAALRSMPASAQGRRFFEYWTLKEAYIKARGMGLSLGLDTFAFELGNPLEIGLSVDPAVDEDAGRWRFWQFEIASDYLIALCCEARGGDPRIAFTRRTPLLARADLTPAPVRRSAPLHSSFVSAGARVCWH
ncbi:MULTISPECIES: 4'-phosphopantetheinyl transferase family protein [unclassified Sphingomonas]|jgi:4'-phosphopantetheinyl transferase|uniref:4'-phosphopantetheinyl transferase family protein n=1 Tax=unclassified Sphingomonas TaxID=196159 RepID=UPI00082C5B1A|nr:MULTISPECIES: 4'-phosphopantetheinyl transferase superfamily protein [unclassified Sphingomonas]